MANLILYAETPKNINVGPCTHDIKPGDKYHLSHEYAKKYNNCVFCAIKAWGYMTHAEIAKCLGTTRINVCLIEKRAVNKIKKALKFSCKFNGNYIIDIDGINNPIEKYPMLEIALLVANDLSIKKPIKLKFINRDVSIDGMTGMALYEQKQDYHLITFNVHTIKSRRHFIETLLHEFTHAAQIDGGKLLDDQICEVVANEFSNRYCKKYQKIVSNVRNYLMVGIKHGIKRGHKKHKNK